MEAGGPMRSSKHKQALVTDGGSDAEKVIEGRDPHALTNGHSAHSSGYMSPSHGNGHHPMSAFGKEMSDNSPYTKSHAERTGNKNGDSGES